MLERRRTSARASGRQATAPSPQVANNLRYLVGRWKLQRKGGVPRRLGVTATLRGEGVSYISRALATVLAHDLEHTVCVVELDWWSPSETSEQDGSGMAGVLRGTTTLDEALQLGDDGLVWRLPPGDATDDERPILAQSGRLEVLVEELNARFDHVILDLPALQSTGESLALVGLAEECVLVIRHGVTTVDQVRTSVEQLDGVTVAGVILNKSRSRIPKALLKRIAT